MTINIPTPTLNKTRLLVVTALSALALILAFAIVWQVRGDTAAASARTRAAAAQREHESQLNDRITSLEGQNKTLQANVNASCTYLASLTKQKSTMSLVIVPTASGCPNPR
jgi:uncharacterized protein YlxW (UPF0749 family)